MAKSASKKKKKIVKRPTVVCPKCENSYNELLSIDAGMRLRLEQVNYPPPIPAQVCSNCYTEISGFVSRGAKLLAEEHAKEQHRQSLWKNRIQIIKKGREAYEKKTFSEAAVFYEQYLKVVEMVHHRESGQLNPELISGKGRTKENTVIASVYWDLIRIYDGSPKHRARQKEAQRKLLEFLPHTNVKGDILKQAKNYISRAKNPEIFKEIVNRGGFKASKCFVATASFPEGSWELNKFYEFREKILVKSLLGRIFIKFYYLFGPLLAKPIEKVPFLKFITRKILHYLALCLKLVLP